MSATQEQAAKFGHDHINDPLPKNGIVVLYMNNCPHCQQSLSNTGFATQTHNGTPVKWVDLASAEGQGAFGAIPRTAADQAKGAMFIGGEQIKTVPVVVLMKDGVATSLAELDEAVYPKKVWEAGQPETNAIAPNGLDVVASRVQLSAGRSVGGNTVPNTNSHQQAVGNQR